MKTFKELNPTFDIYMTRVDKWLFNRYMGLVSEDLDDYLWYDAYEDEINPEDAAKEMLVKNYGLD